MSSVQAIRVQPQNNQHKSQKAKGAAAIGASLGAIGGGVLGSQAGVSYAEELTSDIKRIANLNRHPDASRLTIFSRNTYNDAKIADIIKAEKPYARVMKTVNKITNKCFLKGMGTGIAVGAGILGTLGYGIAKLCTKNK